MGAEVSSALVLRLGPETQDPPRTTCGCVAEAFMPRARSKRRHLGEAIEGTGPVATSLPCDEAIPGDCGGF